MSEAIRLSDDLTNVLTSSEIPILIVGRDLRLRRFTPAAGRVFGLLATDLGRPVSDVRQTRRDRAGPDAAHPGGPRAPGSCGLRHPGRWWALVSRLGASVRDARRSDRRDGDLGARCRCREERCRAARRRGKVCGRHRRNRSRRARRARSQSPCELGEHGLPARVPPGAEGRRGTAPRRARAPGACHSGAAEPSRGARPRRCNRRLSPRAERRSRGPAGVLAPRSPYRGRGPRAARLPGCHRSRTYEERPRRAELSRRPDRCGGGGPDGRRQRAGPLCQSGGGPGLRLRGRGAHRPVGRRALAPGPSRSPRRAPRRVPGSALGTSDGARRRSLRPAQGRVGVPDRGLAQYDEARGRTGRRGVRDGRHPASGSGAADPRVSGPGPAHGLRRRPDRRAGATAHRHRAARSDRARSRPGPDQAERRSRGPFGRASRGRRRGGGARRAGDRRPAHADLRPEPTRAL